MNLYLKVIGNVDKAKGQVFNIGSGIENNISLIEIFDILEKRIRYRVEILKISLEKKRSKNLCSRYSKAKKILNGNQKY